MSEVVNNRTSDWPSQSTFQAHNSKVSVDDEMMKKMISDILESKLTELKNVNYTQNKPSAGLKRSQFGGGATSYISSPREPK